MRILLLSVSLVFSLLPQLALSASISMEQCNTTIAEFNQPLPRQLDDITTWVDTSCVDLGEGSIQLIFANEVADGSDIGQAELEAARPTIVMSWCLGPTLWPLIQVVDTVKYQYQFENGEPIGELDFTVQECIRTEPQ